MGCQKGYTVVRIKEKVSMQKQEDECHARETTIRTSLSLSKNADINMASLCAGRTKLLGISKMCNVPVSSPAANN